MEMGSQARFKHSRQTSDKNAVRASLRSVCSSLPVLLLLSGGAAFAQAASETAAGILLEVSRLADVAARSNAADVPATDARKIQAQVERIAEGLGDADQSSLSD